MKRCSTCGYWKDEAGFDKRKGSSDGLRGVCKICTRANLPEKTKGKRKISSRKWYERNRELTLARARKQREHDPDAQRKYRRLYYVQYRTAITAKNHLYRQSHLDRLHEKDRLYYEKNKDKIKQNIRAYALEHPEIAQRHQKRRRIFKAMTVKSDVTYENCKRLLETYNHSCAYCLRPLTAANKTFDHMRPVTKGGLHLMDNLVPCCRSCNSRKQNKTLLEMLWGKCFILPIVLSGLE